jgi:hypothetical protein
MQASNAAFTQQSDGHYPQQRRGINIFLYCVFFYVRLFFFFCHQQCDRHYPQQRFGHIYENTEYIKIQKKKHADGFLYQDRKSSACSKASNAAFTQHVYLN